MGVLAGVAYRRARGTHAVQAHAALRSLLALFLPFLGLGNIEVIMFFCWGAYYAPFVFLGYACVHKSARMSDNT
jgi:hypothetical protein